MPTPNKNIKLSLSDVIKHNLSTFLMDVGRGTGRFFTTTDYKNGDTYDGGTAQRTYFMDRDSQRKIFLRDGYTEDKSKNYGLVKKAVGNRDIPIYQKAKDDEQRENLIAIGNVYNSWNGKKEAELAHAGSYPTAIYINPNTKMIYQKAWDLNDYGGGTGASKDYKGIRKTMADLADNYGSPVVVTSGISEVGSFDNIFYKDGMYRSDIGKMVDDFYKSKGLTRFTNYETIPLRGINNKIIKDNNGNDVMFEKPFQDYGLPEVTIIGKRKRRSLSGKY